MLYVNIKMKFIIDIEEWLGELLVIKIYDPYKNNDLFGLTYLNETTNLSTLRLFEESL